MTSTTASRRHLIVVLFLTALGIAVAVVVGTAPLVFLIWMLRGMPHWLSF